MSIENEIWKRVTVDFYCNYFAVSNTGKLKRISRISKTDGHLIPEKILCFKKTKKGYNRCDLRINGISKSFYLHRLIALAFIPQINGKPHVNHKDGNKLNNHVSNLEWCTPQENNEHGVSLGLLKRGRNIKPYVSKKTEWGTYKPIIDLNTGTFWKVEDVAGMVGTSKKYMMKMLRGERLNTTQYKYA